MRAVTFRYDDMERLFVVYNYPWLFLYMGSWRAITSPPVVSKFFELLAGFTSFHKKPTQKATGSCLPFLRKL